jgi:hypothetical protein
MHVIPTNIENLDHGGDWPTNVWTSSREDGSLRTVDLEAHLDGEIFAPLRDLKQFRTARLNPDLDTVVWNNGADMSPDFLYEIGMTESETPTRKVAEGKARYGI